jgi:tmRNA-binding protein
MKKWSPKVEENPMAVCVVVLWWQKPRVHLEVRLMRGSRAHAEYG